MNAATRTDGIAPIVRPSTTRQSSLTLPHALHAGRDAGESCARRHDRESQPRVHPHQAKHCQRRRIIPDPEAEQDAEHEIRHNRAGL